VTRPDTAPLGRRFWRVWSAATVSATGDGLRVAFLPLLAAGVTRDPRAVALVTAAGFAPWPLLGLLGGAVADRVDRRRAMWVIDAARGALMAGFAVLVANQGVSIGVLCAVAFALGTAQTVFDNAATALLPTVVAAGGLARANARLRSAQAVAVEFIGPPLGGLLFAVAAPLPPALDAVSFLTAAALIATLTGTRRTRTTRAAAAAGTARPKAAARTARPARAAGSAPAKPRVVADIGDGLRWLAHQPFLRTLTAVTAVLGAITGALLAVLVLYVRDVLGLGGAGYGILFGCYGAGSIAGALSCPRLLRRHPAGRLLTAALITTVLILTALAATTNPAVAAVALAVFGIAGGVWGVTDATLWQTLVPNDLLGRVASAYRTTVATAMTLGAGLAGVTAHTAGIPATLLGCAVLTAVLTATLGRRLATTPTSSASPDRKDGWRQPIDGGQVGHVPRASAATRIGLPQAPPRYGE